MDLEENEKVRQKVWLIKFSLQIPEWLPSPRALPCPKQALEQSLKKKQRSEIGYTCIIPTTQLIFLLGARKIQSSSISCLVYLEDIESFLYFTRHFRFWRFSRFRHSYSSASRVLQTLITKPYWNTTCTFCGWLQKQTSGEISFHMFNIAVGEPG